jgi:hypothetical protein
MKNIIRNVDNIIHLRLQCQIINRTSNQTHDKVWEYIIDRIFWNIQWQVKDEVERLSHEKYYKET